MLKIDVTKEECEKILPKNVKDSGLSEDAKIALGILLKYYERYELVRDCDYVILPNKEFIKMLNKICNKKIDNDLFYSTIRQLTDANIVERNVGMSSESASEYTVNFDELSKPIDFGTFESLMNKIHD